MTHDNPRLLSDRELGMDRAIPRRDFLNGAAMAIGAAMLPNALDQARQRFQQ